VPCKGRVFFPKDFFLLTRPQFSWNFISYQESVSLIEIFLLEMGFLSLSLSLSLCLARANQYLETRAIDIVLPFQRQRSLSLRG